MAVDINWEDLVGDKTLKNGGYIGDLMDLAAVHIVRAQTSGGLTKADAGAVYTSMITSAYQTGLQYLLNEQLTEANIDKAKADATAAKAESDRLYAQMLAEIDKVYGFDYELDDNDDLIRSSLEDAADGKLDYENEKMEADVEIARSKAANTQAETIASIDKIYGYAWTIDPVTGYIVIGDDQLDGKLDYENTLVQEQTEDIEYQRELKALGIQVGAWTSTYGNGMINNVPDILDNDSIDTQYDKVK